jgi:hypothetical protein
MSKFTNWLYNYSYENWKFTPSSKKVMYGAASILAAGVIGAFIISKKK